MESGYRKGPMEARQEAQRIPAETREGKIIQRLEYRGCRHQKLQAQIGYLRTEDWASIMDIQTEMNGRLLHVQLPPYEYPPAWLPPEQRRHHPDYCNNIQLFLPRIIKLKRSKVADALGFNVRGGKDYFCGVYISKVSPGTDAERLGLQEGDQILLVNGINFEDIYHSKAVKALKSHTDIEMVVRFFPYGYNKTYDKSRTLSAVQNQQRQQIPQTVNGSAPPSNRAVLSPLTVPDATTVTVPSHPPTALKPQQQRFAAARYDPAPVPSAEARVAPSTAAGPMLASGVGYPASVSYRQPAPGEADLERRRALSPNTAGVVSPTALLDSPQQQHQQQMPRLVRAGGGEGPWWHSPGPQAPQAPQGPDSGGLVMMSSGSATSATLSSSSTGPAFAATRSIQRVVASGGPSFQQQQPRPSSYYGAGRSENTSLYTGGDLPPPAGGGDTGGGGYWSTGGFGSSGPHRYSGQFNGQYQ